MLLGRAIEQVSELGGHMMIALVNAAILAKLRCALLAE